MKERLALHLCDCARSKHIIILDEITRNEKTSGTWVELRARFRDEMVFHNRMAELIKLKLVKIHER